MAIVKTDSQHYSDIAAAIRQKKNETQLYQPPQMASAILSITTGAPNASPKLTVTAQNGATITAVQGDVSLSAVVTNGTCTFTLPSYGDWDLTNSAGGSTTVAVEQTTSVNLTTYHTSFADAPWDEIIRACRSDSVPSSWKIGDTHTLPMSDIPSEESYTVRIIGKHCDPLVSGSETSPASGAATAPLTLELVQVLDTICAYHSAAAAATWATCDLRGTTLPGLLGVKANWPTTKLPSLIYNHVRPVWKKTNGVWTKDSFFILSLTEYFGGDAAYGTRYPYYASNHAAKTSRFGTDTYYYWTRNTIETGAWCVTKTGTTDDVKAQTSLNAVAFAFCM